MTEKQKKITALITVTGVCLLLISLIALIYNIVSLATLSSKRAALEERSAYLQSVIEGNVDEIEYRSTREYIEKYARDYLNMKYEDEEVYEPS